MPPYWRGVLFLISAQVLVGINIVSSKYLLQTTPILFLLVMRFALAAIILFAIHWLSSARKMSLFGYFTVLKRRDYYFLLGQALSAGIFFNCFMLLGLHYTDANMAGIITSVLPAIIALLCWIVLGEKLAGKTLLCIAIATFGLIIIALSKLSGQVVVLHSFFGDLLILLALLPEATYYVLCRLYLNPLPVFLTSSLFNSINALLLLPFMLSFPGHIPPINIELCLILVVLALSSGLFFVFWYYGSQHVDTIMASLLTAVMPLATVILAWIFLGERLTNGQYVGMSLVILSIFVYAKH